ncbi:MAG TPA: hypothetical protein VM165_07715 [Planctomycetaceae bacterium]|nr:hypothetical protein [Planctomycetaceae bacterium]
MIDLTVSPSRPPSDPGLRGTAPSDWQKAFVEMLPEIRDHAHYAFRQLPFDLREEAIQEVVCNACQAYARLAERGRTAVAAPITLARYAIRQHRVGRRVGQSLNSKDITSPYCQCRRHVQVESLCRPDIENGTWEQILVEDASVTPADLAASRIDYAAFLATLDRRRRRIAETLSTGETTKRAAKRFRVCPARISQFRRELQQAWNSFVGDVCPASAGSSTSAELPEVAQNCQKQIWRRRHPGEAPLLHAASLLAHSPSIWWGSRPAMPPFGRVHFRSGLAALLEAVPAFVFDELIEEAAAKAPELVALRSAPSLSSSLSFENASSNGLSPLSTAAGVRDPVQQRGSSRLGNQSISNPLLREISMKRIPKSSLDAAKQAPRESTTIRPDENDRWMQFASELGRLIGQELARQHHASTARKPPVGSNDGS